MIAIKIISWITGETFSRTRVATKSSSGPIGRSRPGTKASDSGTPRKIISRSSLLGASTASGIQAIRSYQESV